MARQLLHVGTARVDFELRTLERAGQTLALSEQEAELLQLLAAHAGEPVPRARLLQEGLGHRPGLKSRALDHAVTRLRRKLGDPSLIEAVYGVGYRLLRPDDPDLVGRGAELAWLSSCRDAGRLLMGPGGIGKTRLARTQGGVFVGCAGCRSQDQVANAVAAALDCRLGALDEVLRHHGPVLVLDNLEQLDASGDALLVRWLEEGLRVLGTSRRRHAFATAVLELSLLDEVAVVALLHRRGGPQHSLPPGLAALVGGLPLAVELLAARTRVASLQELEARLDLGVLGGDRVQGMLEETWSLLSPRDQRALRAVGAFEGGFDLAGWEAVWGGPDALDRLQGLAEWSLVRRQTARIRVLDTVERFARLKGSEPWVRAHADHYGALGGCLAEGARLRGDTEQLRRERANLQRASALSEDAAEGLDALLAWEGAHALRLTLLEGSSLRWRKADALAGLGRHEEALEVLAQPVTGRELLTRGAHLLFLGRFAEAEATLGRARAVLASEEDPARAAGARFNLAHLAALRGHIPRAIDEARAALQELEPLDAAELRAAMLSGLAAFMLEAGQVAAARSTLARIPEGVRAHVRLHVDYALAWVEVDSDLSAASARFARVALQASECGEASLAADAQEGRGATLEAQGLPGLRELDAAIAVHRRLGRSEPLRRARLLVSAVEGRASGQTPELPEGAAGQLARCILSRR